MPRGPRLEVPGIPLHVIHRGVNRAATFLDDDDRTWYRCALAEAISEHDVSLHAYVLMTNHVHLLLTADKAGAISHAMCDVGRRYVPGFNRKHGRTGTLWEGRFKSCLVDSQRYLLELYRYIELNPVRAAMAEKPDQYPWSSVHANLGQAHDSLLTPHPLYEAMAATPDARARVYRQWLEAGTTAQELDAIRRHLQQQCALGDDRFQAMVAETLQLPVRWRSPGRPRRNEADAPLVLFR